MPNKDKAEYILQAYKSPHMTEKKKNRNSNYHLTIILINTNFIQNQFPTSSTWGYLQEQSWWGTSTGCTVWHVNIYNIFLFRCPYANIWHFHHEKKAVFKQILKQSNQFWSVTITAKMTAFSLLLLPILLAWVWSLSLLSIQVLWKEITNVGNSKEKEI